MFVVSVFLPCLSERGIAVLPPFPVFTEFWSFQAVTRCGQGFLKEIRFHDYWLGEFYATPKVWLMMFVVQLVTVVFIVLSIVKDATRRLTLLLAVLGSAVTTLLCYLQSASTSARIDLNNQRVTLESGFFAALTSSVLLFVLLLMYVACKD